MVDFGAVGDVLVKTTNERGFSAEEHAEDLLAKILYISDTAHPLIKEQAVAFKNAMYPVIVYHMKAAMKSDRTTLMGQLRKNGQFEMAEIIGKMS